MSKQPTTEELLKLLEQPAVEMGQIIPVSASHYKNDVLSFLEFFRLKAGRNRIEVKNLYALYTAWSKTTLELAEFKKELNGFFKLFSEGQDVYTKINRSALNLTKIAYSHYIKPETKLPSVNIYKNHFENFLKSSKILPGNYLVPPEALYFLYDKWVYKTKSKETLKLHKFTTLCSLYFKKETNNGTSKFAVDKRILRFISEKDIETIIGTSYDKKTKAKEKN